MKLFPSTISLILFILAGTASSIAQPIRNLDFETAGVVNPDQPVAWLTQWVGHQVSLDSTVAYSGTYSFKSQRLADRKSGYGIARLRIPGAFLKEKHVRVTAWVRSQGISTGNAMLRLIAFDQDNNVVEFIPFPKKGITDTGDWRQHSAEVVINKKAHGVILDIFHSGNGAVWVDDIAIEIDGEAYDPSSYVPWSATPDEIAWLKTHATPLATDEPGSGFADLDKLKPLFRDAQLIGLGEATHGTREFFRMKHRLIEWLAAQQDTVLFAIEASMPAARIVNNYILHGKGNPKEALADLRFWTWNTQEVLDLIEWMRYYNKSGQGRIEFWGFDMQFPEVAADSVRSFVAKVDPPYLDELEKRYSIIEGPEVLRGLNDEELAEIYQAVTAVRSHLEANRDRYLTLTDEMTLAWAVQYARIIEQSVERFMPNGDSRDRSIAKNINWIYNHKSTDAPVLIWAHNAHIQRSPTGFGRFLADQHGDAYKNIGFAFGEGKYTAVLEPGGAVSSYPAPSPRKGSVEHVLRAAKMPMFALDLHKVKNNPDGSWLITPKPFRNIGSIAKDEPYHEIPVAEYFDVLIYFDRTTASRSFGQPDNQE